jgi:hypothetical protein
MTDRESSPRHPSSFSLHPSTDLIAAVALVLLGTLFFAPVLCGSRVFFARDILHYYYPAKHLLREIVLRGEFPYWNPYFSAGQPLAANPEHEVFYPLNWLILLPSFRFGFNLQIVLHVWICLLGTYALLRSMEARPSAAFLGALSFGLGGGYLSYVNLLPYLYCAAWLPMTCLFARRFLLRRTGRDFALASLFLALQLLAGEPTTILQTGILLGIYALYRGWKNIGWIAAMSGAAFLAAAVQMLPALDHIGQSSRSRQFSFGHVSTWSMPWARLGELFYPNLLGHVTIDGNSWWWARGLYDDQRGPFLYSIHTSLLIAVIAVAAIFVRRRGGGLMLTLASISVLLAAGSHTPLLRWLYDAGIAQTLRYPEKFALLGLFSMCIFGAVLLDRIAAGDRELLRAAVIVAGAITAIAALMFAISFTPAYATLFTRAWRLAAGDTATRAMQFSRFDWIVAIVRGLAVIILLRTATSSRRAVWTAAATAVIALDLYLLNGDVNPTAPSTLLDPPPVAASLPAYRDQFRVFHEAQWYTSSPAQRRWFADSAQVPWVARNGLFPHTPALLDLRTVMEPDYDRTQLLPTVDFVGALWDVHAAGRPEWPAPFLAMSNAWGRVLMRDYHGEDRELANPVAFIAGLPVPRYYFATQMVTIHDRAEFVADLSRAPYPPRVAFTSLPAFAPAKAIVRHVTESANSAAIDVESAGRAFLVMSVTPQKYWRITIDGSAVPAVVTNIGYQGVEVPAGRHRIAMRYRNPLVIAGGTISIVTIMLLIAVCRPLTVGSWQ